MTFIPPTPVPGDKPAIYIRTMSPQELAEYEAHACHNATGGERCDRCFELVKK